jgi:hypothetical protein
MLAIADKSSRPGAALCGNSPRGKPRETVVQGSNTRIQHCNPLSWQGFSAAENYEFIQCSG